MNVHHKRTQLSSLGHGGSYVMAKVVSFVMIVTFVMTGNSLSPEVLGFFIFHLRVRNLSLYSTRTQNYWRWILLRRLTQKIVLLRYLMQKIPTCWYLWR